MLFKNATIVRLVKGISRDNDEITKTLQAHKFVPARAVEFERRGWVSPTGEEDDDLIYCQGAVSLLCMQIEQKILPNQVIQEELKERLKIRGLNWRSVRTKEKQQMLEEIKFDLLPKAFSKYSRVMGYIDYQRQEIVVGSASPGQVDEFLSFLRLSLGSLPAIPVQSDHSASMRMTKWVKLREAPPKVRFGKEISLYEHDGGKGTFQKQDLLSDEIQECIGAGKTVQRLALEWNDYIGFTVDENWTIRKLSPLDMFDESYDGDDAEENDLAAKLFLTVMALRQLLPEFYSWFGIEDIDGDDTEGAFDSDDTERGMDVDDFDHDSTFQMPELSEEEFDDSYEESEESENSESEADSPAENDIDSVEHEPTDDDQG